MLKAKLKKIISCHATFEINHAESDEIMYEVRLALYIR